MVEMSDALTAAAAFAGGFLGQVVRAGRLEPQLREFGGRVKKLEGYSSIVRRYLGRVNLRLVRLERAQEARREA